MKGSKNKAMEEDDSMTVGEASQQQTEGVQNGIKCRFLAHQRVEVMSQAFLSYLIFVFPHMDVISPNLPGFAK